MWPLLVLGVLALARRRGASERRSLQILLGLSLSGALVASVEMALLFGSGRGLDRVYYGTDTRATGLLLGASLAIAVALRRRARPAHPAAAPRLVPAWARQALAAASLVVAALLAAGIVLADGDDAWVYPFGMLATDAAMVVLIAAIVLRPRRRARGSWRWCRSGPWARSPTASTSGTSRCSCGSTRARPASGAPRCWSCAWP